MLAWTPHYIFSPSLCLNINLHLLLNNPQGWEMLQQVVSSLLVLLSQFSLFFWRQIRWVNLFQNKFQSSHYIQSNLCFSKSIAQLICGTSKRSSIVVCGVFLHRINVSKWNQCPTLNFHTNNLCPIYEMPNLKNDWNCVKKESLHGG